MKLFSSLEFLLFFKIFLFISCLTEASEEESLAEIKDELTNSEYSGEKFLIFQNFLIRFIDEIYFE
jgi:hypothetical protein